ncbi:hypothetical protein [Caldivirga maquilingensis]|uniref:Uncharacterized protein n=1 Tax=Caldivirga maquilingensis (strain ATCC 700844 / DSM 13496 / JCM 10307 / IC-167) TaxID=397948 RepID=A8MDP3_CALMQ|nr:hypothetical protein [Caldivirga maquilingensis]ABW01899.1 hypothetical protein Cmaq_1070 [Caldivirga maquilingensis IC-167]
MIEPIRLKLGDEEAQFIVYTMLLEEPLSNEALSMLLSNTEADVFIIIDGSTSPTVNDLLYYLYLAHRNVNDGVSIARDANVEAMLYVQCTTQINEAKRISDPLGKRLVTVAALSIGRGVRVNPPLGDFFIGSVSRLSRGGCGRGKVIRMIMGRISTRRLITNDS